MSEVEASQKINTFADFLQEWPPESVCTVSDATRLQDGYLRIATPAIELYCEECEGRRSFDCQNYTINAARGSWKNGFLDYQCRNCKSQLKYYALAVLADKTTGVYDGQVYKYGELPLFGDALPPRVFSLIGKDQELFRKGRKAENRGLGIGAFAYYRRVVENQWERIVGEVTKVAQKLGTAQALIDELHKVAKHTQFGRAVDSVKPAVPEVLLIDGHNPLTLLHSALSEAIHDHSDQECLELAQDIRIVLAELADRASQALKDEDTLKQAVSRLLNRKNGKGTPATQSSTVVEPANPKAEQS